jgi:DNA-binding CsgD family transcriptional regulator
MPDFDERKRAVVAALHATDAANLGGGLARFIDPDPAALSPKVRDVLRCVLEGDGNKRIAARLSISVFTVNQYVKTIIRHFGVQSRTELLAWRIKRGWGGRFAWADPRT